MRKTISVTVPCYNEVKNVRPMAEALTNIMMSLDYDYEIIFTDNFSEDGTREVLRELAAEDKHIKVLFNNRNYGVDGRSARNTIRYCKGDAIINIPCDFQEPPELIPEFIQYWENGFKVVCGQKIGSKEGKIKYFFRCLYYRIIKTFSDVPQYDNISGITLLTREVYEELLKTDEDIKLRHAIADMGYRIKLIPYIQEERKSGKSSYNIWRYLTFAIDSLVNTSVSPLRIMTITGFGMSIVSFLIGLVYFIIKLIKWDWFQAGIAPILIGMLFLGSIQLLCLGIIGEYVGVVLRKVSRRPDVIVDEKIGFDDRKDNG